MLTGFSTFIATIKESWLTTFIQNMINTQVHNNESIIKNDSSPTFQNVTMGGILYYNITGPCDLTLSKSTCSNSSGRYLVE